MEWQHKPHPLDAAAEGAEMTTQEKLLEAAEAALEGFACDTLRRHGLREIALFVTSYRFEFDISDRIDPLAIRCLYLCFLAAAWDDL